LPSQRRHGIMRRRTASNADGDTIKGPRAGIVAHVNEIGTIP
jgi:hypothetical protein